MTEFTNTFGGSPVSPADVAYAAYSFSENLVLCWPQFSAGQTTVAARFMNLVATVASLNVYMPDATLNSVGYDAIVFNAGSNTLNVVNYSGGAIATIPSGQTYYIILNNNATQAGGWQTVQFGVGTGSASAAALAGYGLLAVAGLLNVNLAAQIVSANFSITPSSQAVPYVWAGGSGAVSLPTAPSVGNGFFFALANNGSGSVTILPNGGNTIDGNSSSVFSQTQSGFILSDGVNWITIGKGIQNTFAVTLLNLNVSGGSNVIETSAQAENIIQIFTGALTGNISVVVPSAVQLYFCSNQTTGNFTLEVKTASGTGVVVPQSTQNILYCDGTNVDNAYTATVSGAFALANGSVALPSLNFQNSISTGLFSPGTGLMSATASGTEVMRFGSNASAINYFGVVATQAGTPLAIGAIGADTNINISIVPKGNGYVTCGYMDATIIGANSAAAITGTTITASSSFIGNLIGNVTGNLTGNVTGTATNVTGIVSLANGGTSANITASLGGIFYSTASAGAILGGTSTASQVLLSGSSSAPSWSSATYPSATTINQLVYSSANNVVTGLATAASALLVTSAGGIPSISTAIPNGVTATTQAASDSTAKIATTGFVNGTALTLATGTTAVTQASGDNTTNVATTAFVSNNTQTARAWCVFDGTLTGTNAPIAGFNISSITRLSAGIYTVNFGNALPNANYSASASQANYTPYSTVIQINANFSTFVAPSTSAFTFSYSQGGAGPVDSNRINVLVFG